jgi:hypothetical protein
MSATLEFLSAHEAGVVLPTIAFLIQQVKDGDTEEALSLPPPPPTLTPQPPPSKESSIPATDAPPVTSSSSSQVAGGKHGSAAPRRLSADAMIEATSEPAAKAPSTSRMAIGGLPPPSPYVPLQRARQHHQRTHEDPNGGGGGYTRTVSGSSRQYNEDGTLSGTTNYVDRWFEKLFFRNPLVVGGGGVEEGVGAVGVGGRPPSASRIDERLGKSSSHRSSSSAARRLRCELFAERAAGVLRSNSSLPASGLASVNSSSALGMPPRDPSIIVPGTDYSNPHQQGSKCAYGDALDDYAAVSPVRRVFQANASRPSSGMPSIIGGRRSSGKDQTRARSRVDDAIAAAHRIRSGSARNSRPSSRCARTDDC